MSESYREAIERRGHREEHATGLPVRVRIMPWRLLRSRFGWLVTLTRDYIPAMATPNGRQWWTIAHWHRLQIGPLVILWRTRKAPSDTPKEPHP